MPQVSAKTLPYCPKKSLIYQVIFVSLALIFAFLGMVAYFKMARGFLLPLSDSPILIKPAVCALCFLFSSCAFFIGLSIRPEKELVNHYVLEAMEKLSKSYRHKKWEEKLPFFPLFGEEYLRFSRLRHKYHEAKDTIRRHQEHAWSEVQRILHKEELSKEARKESLKEAIDKLHAKLDETIEVFQKS